MTEINANYVGVSTSYGTCEPVPVAVSNGRPLNESFFVMGNISPSQPPGWRDYGCLVGLTVGMAGLAGGLLRGMFREDETITSTKPLSFLFIGSLVSLSTLLSVCDKPASPPRSSVHRTTKTRVEDLGKRNGNFRARLNPASVKHRTTQAPKGVEWEFKLPKIPPEIMLYVAALGAAAAATAEFLAGAASTASGLLLIAPQDSFSITAQPEGA